MLKEVTNRTREDSTDPAWQSSPELEERVEEARRNIEKSRENAKKRIIPDPVDGSPSRFVRYEGAHGRVVAVFKSESGHEFFVG